MAATIFDLNGIGRVDSGIRADISAASLVLVAPARGFLSWGKPQEDNALYTPASRLV